MRNSRMLEIDSNLSCIPSSSISPLNLKRNSSGTNKLRSKFSQDVVFYLQQASGTFQFSFFLRRCSTCNFYDFNNMLFIWPTRSCVALRAADLDWIVGPYTVWVGTFLGIRNCWEEDHSDDSKWIEEIRGGAHQVAAPQLCNSFSFFNFHQKFPRCCNTIFSVFGFFPNWISRSTLYPFDWIED